MDDEVKFVELWEAGTKLSEIQRILDIDCHRVSYLCRKHKVTPRRNIEEQRKRHQEVWEMIQKRVPIEEIAALKGVTEIYVIQVINKAGYKVREFYPNRKRKPKPKIIKTRNGVKCTPDDCTCFKRKKEKDEKNKVVDQDDVLASMSSLLPLV